jgi:hypothetical protein
MVFSVVLSWLGGFFCGGFFCSGFTIFMMCFGGLAVFLMCFHGWVVFFCGAAVFFLLLMALALLPSVFSTFWM